MYSFDVFDTLITRKTANPRGIFALIQNKLNTCDEYKEFPEHIAVNFYELRIHAERLARVDNSSKGKEEVTLKDIYTALALSGCLTTKQQDMLCELEKVTELENSVGITENINKVKELVAKGERVILISDMYLDQDTIRQMLVKADAMFAGIPLYVSSELQQRKTSGNLYRRIKEAEKVDYSDWIHLGDNLHQDIEVPIRLGMNAQYYEAEKLTGFEESLIEVYGNNAQLQLIIGTAKNVRKQYNLTSGAERIGASYAGPVLYSYTDWLLKESIRKNISRLYFIARDGYLVKCIADIIIKSRKYDIKTYYLYGSRKAWRMPSLSDRTYNLYEVIKWSHISKIKTIKDLAEVLLISEDELLPFLPNGCRSTGKPITNQILQYLARKLDGDREFKKFILDKTSQTRELVRDYLKQEIDMSDDAFAFVDVSGGGFTQGCLYHLLCEDYNKPIHTFYFKIDRVNLVEGSMNHVFLPSFLDNNLVVEMICRAPHGQTVGYERSGGNVQPVFERMEEETLIRHGFAEYQKGIECYAEQREQLQKEANCSTDSLEIVLKYLNYIARKPDKDVLEFFASLPNSESGRERRIVEYAPRLSREDIENIYLRRTTERIEEFYSGTNYEYSLLRCSKEDLAYIEQCKSEYHSARGMLIRQDKTRAEEDMYKRFGSAWRYPCEILEERILLYGAGKFGRGLYDKITALGTSKVVQWVDKEFAKYNQQGVAMVESPDMIGTREYDQLVIAVLKEELAISIEQELIKQGVCKDRMIWMSCDPQDQNYVKWY